MDNDPKHRREQEAEHPQPNHGLQKEHMLLTGEPESITLLEERIVQRLRLALDDDESGKDQLREALLFHCIQPETVQVQQCDRHPELYQIYGNALTLVDGQLTTMERPIRLLDQPVSVGSSIRRITDAVEESLSVFPRDAVAFLQHVRPTFPENVYVLPSTHGSIRPLDFSKDTRFRYEAVTRTIHDYRQTTMTACIEHAEEVWEQLAAMSEQEGILRVYVQTSRSDPWKINIYKMRADPLRRFRSILYPKGRGKPRTVTVGDLDDDTGWEEKRDEIYPYDEHRYDFAPEAAENVRHWVREFLALHERVHLTIQLEGDTNADVIVTFYVRNSSSEE